MKPTDTVTEITVESHAVRWLQRKVGLDERYTCWHWTRDATRTLCGCLIPVGGEIAFLPETDEQQESVECNNCLRILAKDDRK